MNSTSNVATILNSDAATMSSIEIAELTGKRHTDVMGDIKRIFENIDIDSTLFCSKYKMPSGQNTTVYNLPFDKAILILMSYSKTRVSALKLIPDVLIRNLIQTIENLDVADLPPDRFVYVAKEEFSGRFKVGISKHPEERIKQLNTGNPEHLLLVHAYLATEKGYLSETLAHAVLSDNKLRSEWFDKGTDLTLLPSYVE